MTDTLTYTCTGLDPVEARRVLFAAVEEMHRRDHIVTHETPADRWAGPDMHLTIEDVDRLDEDGQTALRHLLTWGRKLGVTGVVRGPAAYGMPMGVSGVIRALLMEGVPLRFEAATPAPV